MGRLTQQLSSSDIPDWALWLMAHEKPWGEQTLAMKRKYWNEVYGQQDGAVDGETNLELEGHGLTPWQIHCCVVHVSFNLQ